MPDALPPAVRVDRSMSLLGDMASAALDPSYAEVATRRGQAGPTRPGRRTTLVVGVVCAGLVTGVAAAQVRKDAKVVDGVRTSLVADVRRETRQSDLLAQEVAGLRDRVAAVRAEALGADTAGRSAAARLDALEVVTGAAAVHGPALEVVLDDAADDVGVTDRGGQPGDGRVFDRDVQDVVNALWWTGAEAVSVNGQRLTAQTAIRSAGEAILVDFRPLSPPYVIRAIGEVDRMEPAFADSATVRRLQTLASLYGVRFTLGRLEDALLPGAADPDLRGVREVTR